MNTKFFKFVIPTILLSSDVNVRRVFGTRNLYVVDASVLPELPSGNINAAVMMVARKAAKILNSHAKRTEVLKRWNKCDKITGYFVALYGLKQSSLNNKIFPF